MSYQTVETIRRAAQTRSVLRIYYIEKDGTSDGWRYVEPYSFSHDRGEEGLFAWDRTKDGIRRFTIERISQIEITGDTYTPRFPIEI